MSQVRGNGTSEILDMPNYHRFFAAAAAGPDHDVTAVQQTRLPAVLAACQMGAGIGQGQPTIGDDLVPVGHQIGLGHDRNGR